MKHPAETAAPIPPNPESIAETFGHCHCILCGSQNPFSLKLKFHENSAGEVQASFRGHPNLQGYEGVLHGGVISALLDAAMTHCLFHAGIRAVTAELIVRFCDPVPCNSVLDLRAKLTHASPPLYKLSAELLCGGKALAKASAKFLLPRQITPEKWRP